MDTDNALTIIFKGILSFQGIIIFVGLIFAIHVLADAQTELQIDNKTVPQNIEQQIVLDMRKGLTGLYVRNAWASLRTLGLFFIARIVALVTVPTPVSPGSYVVSVLHTLAFLSLVLSVERARRARMKALRRDVLAHKTGHAE